MKTSSIPIPQKKTMSEIPSGSSTTSISAKQQLRREQLFDSLISAQVIDLHKIRSISWAGVPKKFRARIWRLFLDYEPVNSSNRELTLDHKRNDYFDCLERVYSPSQRRLWTNTQKQTEMQISKDLPRTKIPLLRNERVQIIFTRVLFTWAVRHPASGYVQGMNDLLKPFFFVFLADRNNGELDQIENLDNLDSFSEDELKIIEADCFWCFSKLLDNLQDVYTKDQPGLYKMLDSLASIIDRVNPELSHHIQSEEIQYQEFAFRWINCLLVREFSLPMIFRLWDSYLSNHQRISSTHVYTCAALLNHFASTLMNENHSDFVIEIQSVNPDDWTSKDMEELIAQAYVYEKIFAQDVPHRSTSLPNLRI